MLSNLPVQVDVVVVGAVVIVCVDVIVWAVGDGHLEQLARTVSLVGWLADCEGHLDFVAGVGAAWVEGCRKDGNAAGGACRDACENCSRALVRASRARMRGTRVTFSVSHHQ